MAAPKVGLKHPKAVSQLEDMDIGTSFKPVIVNDFGDSTAQNVVLCSGKIFFDIQSQINENKSGKPVKVIRVEELAPFPSALVEQELKAISKDVSVTWVQEEGMNQGAFQFAKLHVDRMLEKHDFDQQEMQYLGRPSLHSFCTGAASEHKKQNIKLWSDFNQRILN